MSPPEIREKILDKASRLFAARGYDAVSMRHIATEAGMTQANLYHHFKDKEDLIRSSLAFVFRGKALPFETIAHDESDPEQRLERFVLWFSTLLYEDRIFAKLLFREMMVGDAGRQEYLVKNVFQDSFSILVRLIDDYLDTADPVLSALSLTGTIIGHFQFSKLIRHLREFRPEYGHPETITRHLMEIVRKNAKHAAPMQ